MALNYELVTGVRDRITPIASVIPALGIVAALGGIPGCATEEPHGEARSSSVALSALDTDLCMQEVMDLVGTGHNLKCTAEDVDITELVDVEILDDGCAFPGDTVTMNATFRVALNADHRLDIGLYFSENGVSALEGNDDGGCTAHTLDIADAVDRETGEDDDGFYCSGGLSHACNGDEDCPVGETCIEQSGTDTCGDMEGEVLTTISNFTMTCRDGNVNDLADFVFCSSWRQDGANDLCTTPYAAYPGAPSKCNCSSLDTDIPIQDPCENVVCEEQACMVGECDPDLADAETSGQDLCVYTPTSGGSCDDGSACTEGDTCDDGECVGSTVDCDDSDACTTDSCDPASGCVNATISCDDSDACTTDSCDPASGCVNATISCDDMDACTTDSCDPATGCAYDAVSCDDGDACTADSCDAESGCGHDAISCDDGDACTADSCNTQSGCGHEAISCDDGDACTADSCDAQSGCTHDAISCDDGNECTADSCDPSGGCQHVDNGLCVEETCETAYALGAQAFCDNDIDGDGKLEKNWGWFDTISAGTSTSFTLYAGAAQCDTDKGVVVGEVSVVYDGDTAWFYISSADGFDLQASHVYVSTDPLSTTAPGQFTSIADYDFNVEETEHVVGGFNGEDLYIAVHTVSCGLFE